MINKKEEKQERKAINLWARMKQQSEKRWSLALGLLFLLALLISISVPVYYVPLFNNISAKYGLPSDIARKLTLLDLSLSSLGVETKNMKDAFKKQKMEDESSPFYTAYYQEPEGSRLINAKETYYHEFERTRRRPAEVAGVYQDGKTVGTPEISDTVKGVRSLPKGSTIDDMDYTGYSGGKSSGKAGQAKKIGAGDDGYTDFSYKDSTATTASKDEVLGSSKRQVRGAYDNRGERIIAGQARPKHADMPDFASTIYNSNGQEETLTLKNSPIQKPLVIGEPFTVVKTENSISQLVGDSSFVDTFSTLSNFGVTQGVLGHYVQDDWNKADLFDLFGISGRDMFLSYFYSYAGVKRKYLESAKHLSEIAFHGDDPQDRVLVARGQKDSKIPVVDLGTPPLVLMITVKNNLAACEAARLVYEERMRELIPAYEEAKNTIIGISSGTVGAIGSEPNLAWRGAPGACDCGDLCQSTMQLRDLWNTNVDTARDKCIAIRQAGEVYANACKMVQKLKDENKDTCENIGVLKEKGGVDWFNPLTFILDEGVSVCRINVQWNDEVTAHSFQRCGREEGIDWCEVLKLSAELINDTYSCNPPSMVEQQSREDCVGKIGDLFEEIDTNIDLDSQPGFMFN